MVPCEGLKGPVLPIAVSTGISFLAPNSHILYAAGWIPAHYFSFGGSKNSTQRPLCANSSPETADCGLPIRYCQTPLRPWWLQIDFPAATTLAIPTEATAPFIRPSMLANSRRVRWLSARSNQ